MDSGVTMLLKAAGFDPKVLQAKAEELEKMAKGLAIELHAKVTVMDGRLDNIEKMLLGLTAAAQRQESHLAGVLPAGETSDAISDETKALASEG